MDPKPWLWRKKSSEKATSSGDKANRPVQASDEEIKITMTEKAGLEKNLRIANDKLSSALSECNTKDELVKKNTNVAQEAIAGWERAEAEAVALRRELDEAIKHREAGEERIAHLDLALEECMKQLSFVREEKEQRIHDAIVKTSSEFEKSRTELEEKLKESGERFSKMGVESTQLSKALLAKEKIIDGLHKRLTEADANFNQLLSRLESTEKDNSSLKYEVRVLEKEVEIRNEEREFNRRAAESSHKQHLDSVKRIAKLESECQRLRVLVRKRLPGPAALAKMKNEVELLGRDSSEMRRNQSTPNKRISVLTEQLSNLEDQNRFLKEALNKKMASSSSITDLLYHFRNGPEICSSPCKTVGGCLDLNLMDDFAEMEKLAIDSVNTAAGNYEIDHELAGESNQTVNLTVGSKNEVTGLEQNQFLERNPDKILEKDDHVPSDDHLEESPSENEVESGMIGLEVNKFAMAAVSVNLDPRIEEEQSSVREQNNKLEEELVAIESERTGMQNELEADDKIQTQNQSLRTDLEITAASEKLAECQETILYLSRQLKELAANKEAALSNNVVTPPMTVNEEETNVTQQEDDSSSHRSSLLDRMAEDDTAAEYNLHDGNSTAAEPEDKFILVGDLENRGENGKVESWAIVPTKKLKKGSLWRRLLWRKKKAKSLKLPIAFTS